MEFSRVVAYFCGWQYCSRAAHNFGCQFRLASSWMIRPKFVCCLTAAFAQQRSLHHLTKVRREGKRARERDSTRSSLAGNDHSFLQKDLAALFNF